MCYSKSGYLNTDDWEDHSGFLRSKTSMTWLLQSGQASPNKIPLKVALMIQFFRRGQILPTLVSDLFTPDNLEAPSWVGSNGRCLGLAGLHTSPSHLAPGSNGCGSHLALAPMERLTLAHSRASSHRHNSGGTSSTSPGSKIALTSSSKLHTTSKHCAP